MRMKKPTRTYDVYEVVKVPFPFIDSKEKKVRPALILSAAKSFNGKVGASIMAMITSVKPDQNLWAADIVIENLRAAGLPVPSIIRFKIFTLDHRLILGHLGCLGKKDQCSVQQKLKEIFIL